MGFRSTFITEDYSIQWPEWFINKYANCVNFGKNNQGCLSSIFECKTYGKFDDLPKDIQKSIDWDFCMLDNFIFIYLHECGGITRVQIDKNNIKFSEPTSWKVVDDVEHDYCYGCSDV